MTALHDMLKATRLVRSGRLKEAADLISARVRGSAQTAKEASDRTPRPALGDDAPDFARPAQMRFFGLPSAPLDESLGKGLNRRSVGRKTTEILDGLRLPSPSARPADPPSVPMPDGASFLEHSCRSAHGEFVYKLYVPSGYKGEPLPLLVMLHGCTQSPDDFAAGTQMNAAAEERNLLVAYPAQQQSANVSKCWNWFRTDDQRRDAGEPAKIAAATRQIMAQYPVQRDRVYVAGLSAGGAAAAILGVQYPDLYAAVGVHSGLACGAAHDLSSAMAAMRTGGSPAAIHSPNRSAPPTRAIVFHGDRDNTVNPINGDQVLAQFRAKAEPLLATTLERQTANGLAYTRTVYDNAGGVRVFENWVVHGAGHAWSGGSRNGSYTEPRGPDASREMLRFFLDSGPLHRE
jgi:poly(hydroxyalkanoate) depolymerase family esterase